jgi:guanylate kinase
MYGTSVKAIETVEGSGKICVLDLEAKGVQAIRKKQIPAKFM